MRLSCRKQMHNEPMQFREEVAKLPRMYSSVWRQSVIVQLYRWPAIVTQLAQRFQVCRVFERVGWQLLAPSYQLDQIRVYSAHCIDPDKSLNLFLCLNQYSTPQRKFPLLIVSQVHSWSSGSELINTAVSMSFIAALPCAVERVTEFACYSF